MPEDVLKVYNTEQLTYTKALAIAQVEDKTLRKQLLKLVVKEEWTVETLKSQIKQLQSNPEQDLSLQRKFHPVISRLEKIETQIQAITPQKVKKSLTTYTTDDSSSHLGPVSSASRHSCSCCSSGNLAGKSEAC